MPCPASAAMAATDASAPPAANMPAVNRAPRRVACRAGAAVTADRRRLDRRAGVLFVIAAWILVVPLAAARPVDPSWITGVYDDGDSDAVVTLIAALVGVSDAP